VGAAAAVRISPITDDDVPAVAAFLHSHLNERVGALDWERAVRVPWAVEAPNHGFMLEAQGSIVGAYLAFYCDRVIDGRVERFCNLGAWCVLPEHRFQGLRLLKAILAQDGYHFTDFSPSGSVIPLNRRLGFQDLDTTTALVPNLPWPTWPGHGDVSSDPEVIESTLTGHELQRYRDHATTAAVIHLVLRRDGEWCYVVLRRDRRKGVPGFVSVLHVSNPHLYRRMARRVARHLLVRERSVASLVELRVAHHRPRPSFLLRSSRTKMFRSPHLDADQIDYLYSELVCVPW
jgi:hypothetical protein